MDLRQLRYFIASAEEGNMGRAARRLFVVQSALSRQVRKLEREIGGDLFIRTARGVTLTAVGEAFLPRARRTLAEAAEALVAARAAARTDEGRLRVAPPDVGPWTERVAGALGRFREGHPGVVVERVAIPWVEHPGALLDDIVDVGFGLAANPQDYPPGLVADALAAEPLRSALLPAKHPLARRRSLSLDDLADLPMLLSDRETIPSLHDTILEALRRQDVAPEVVRSPGAFAGLAQLVASGAGWAAVLDMVSASPPAGTAVRRVRGLEAVLEFHVLRRDGADRTVVAFVEALHGQARPGTDAPPRAT